MEKPDSSYQPDQLAPQQEELPSFEDLLEDNGSSSRMKILLIGGGILIILIVVWVVFTMINRPSTTTEDNVTAPQQEQTFEPTVSPGGAVQAVEGGTTIPNKVDTSIAIGLEDTTPTLSGVESSHISTLRELRNILLVNIIDLASEATDRPATLKNYDASLRNISKKVLAIRDALSVELTMANSELSRINKEKEEAMARYEASLALYDGNLAIDELNTFITSQEYAGTLFTQIKHMERIGSLCNSLLGVSERKLAFLKANKEALLYNIDVVDISGLEEDLSQTEEEWRNSL